MSIFYKQFFIVAMLFCSALHAAQTLLLPSVETCPVSSSTAAKTMEQSYNALHSAHVSSSPSSSSISIKAAGQSSKSVCDFVEDLDFMYGQIKENHPGVYNQKDPEFQKHLERAYKSARESAVKAVSLLEQKQVVEAFAKSFNDTHMYVQWKRKSLKRLQSFSDKRLGFFYDDPEIAWIALPTFEFDRKQEQEFKKLFKHVSEVRNKRAIIFDLRGNQGGNSEYASELIDRLFGYDYAQQQRAKAYQSVSIDWRASEDNIDYIQSLYDRYKHDSLKKIGLGMCSGLQKEKPYYTEIPSQDFPAIDACRVPNPVTATIIAIIDSYNVSAALDCIDELKMMEHPLILVGETTRADRLYMDVRAVPLPSESGTFMFPIKVYRNRPRKDNESYKPDIEVNTNNAAALEKCITGIIDSAVAPQM